MTYSVILRRRRVLCGDELISLCFSHSIVSAFSLTPFLDTACTPWLRAAGRQP